MLLYSLLHLTGYDLPLEELEAFRQWGSQTPGPPRARPHAGRRDDDRPARPGLRQRRRHGASPSAHLAARFNRPGHEVVDHRTYVHRQRRRPDGGRRPEAASLAGHLGLGKLIYLLRRQPHLDRRPPPTSSFTEDVAKRFEAYGWHVQHVADGNDLAAIDARDSTAALAEDDRPSLIDRAHPHRLRQPEAGHLGGARRAARRGRGDADEAQRSAGRRGAVPRAGRGAWRTCARRSSAARARRGGVERRASTRTRRRTPSSRPSSSARLAGELPDGLGRRTSRPSRRRQADGDARGRRQGASTRSPRAAGAGRRLGRPRPRPTRRSRARRFPEPVGASPTPGAVAATGATRAATSTSASASTPWARSLNGMALHGGLLPFGATFLIFSDYMRPAIRLAALMQAARRSSSSPTTASALGEDGPTHQPVEQLAALRAIPNLTVIRPGRRQRDGERVAGGAAAADGPVGAAC